MTEEKKQIGKEIVELVVDCIDFEKLTVGLVDNVLDEVLQKIVDDTTNPFDNAAKSMLYPILSDELKKYVAKKVSEIKK